MLHLYEDFKYKLNSHPDFPTLKSISDTLEKFGFENTPVRLKPEELQELDSPFLAYIKDGGQYELTYAHHNSENKISYSSEKKGKVQVSLEAFSSKFNGIAVLLELNKSKIPSVNIKYLDERKLSNIVIALAVLSSIAFFTASFYRNFDWIFSEGSYLIWISSKCIGLALTMALLLKDFGQSGNLINKVCKIGKQADCGTILESRYATVYGWVKWGDLGFIYFLSGLFLIGTYGISAIICLALVVFPYVFISLYQQLFLIKKLCLLCLGVVSILITEFIIGLGSLSNVTISTNELLESTILLLITGSFYLALNSFILFKRTKTVLGFQYNQIKNITEVVNTLIKREGTLTLPEEVPMNYLLFGNQEENSLHIQAFLSLYCGHCGSVFEQLNDFLQKHKNVRVDLFLRFNTKDHEHIKIMEGILQVYHAKEVDKAWNMIRAWYTKGSSSKYQQKNTDEPTERLKKLFFTTKYLMQINQFSSLPKLFVEGFEKFHHYQLEEYLEYSKLFKNKKNIQ